MSRKLDSLLSERTPTEHLGPAMRALNERQRKFVTGMLVFGGSHSEAYKYAGYETTNDKSLVAAAARLANCDGVQAALAEERPRRMNVGATILAEDLYKMAKGEIDVDGKTRLAAINSYLDRAGLSSKTIQEHIIKRDDTSVEELMDAMMEAARIAGPALAGKMLTDRGYEAPIDAEYEIVGDSDGIEDLL
jgi:hypothetical protein